MLKRTHRTRKPTPPRSLRRAGLYAGDSETEVEEGNGVVILSVTDFFMDVFRLTCYEYMDREKPEVVAEMFSNQAYGNVPGTYFSSCFQSDEGEE